MRDYEPTDQITQQFWRMAEGWGPVAEAYYTKASEKTMSKHKKGRSQWNTPKTEELLKSLQYRAEERCSGLGHELGYWSQAKRKKHGVASMQAICTKCGEMVFVSPYMEYTRENPQVPAIKGDILFQLCYKEGRLI